MKEHPFFHWATGFGASGVCFQGSVLQLNHSLMYQLVNQPGFSLPSVRALFCGPKSGFCASKMATEVSRKRLNTAEGLFLSSSCKVCPSRVKPALVILCLAYVFTIWIIKLKASLQNKVIRTLGNNVRALQQIVSARVAPGKLALLPCFRILLCICSWQMRTEHQTLQFCFSC